MKPVLFALGCVWSWLLLASAPACWGKDTVEATADQPLPAAEAAAAMVLPTGFAATLFAGEPDVQQPIGFCIDDRGRLWVAEAFSYPNHTTTGHDRIVILEDTDGDGRADKRTVFYDRLNYVTGIEVGFGGAWVMSPPFFYFIPDRNGDDIPDGRLEVVLDGFGNHANAHNLANGFAWGPDGWLYGTHGRTNWSKIGTPGAKDNDRIQFDGGVYRYHPIRKTWEPFADGTTNPWGIDWNDVGDAFVCNCVTPHLYHVIQGAHYEPWRNRQSSQHAYQRIPAISDHLHHVGQANVREGLFSPAEDAAGGGHAHCGSLIYQGGSWPDRYRNTFLTCNIHGKRINNDLPRREGSGYIASHGPDLMRSRDPWFVGVTLQTGPDGSVYVSDWSDTGECHHTKNTKRETGRIFKISYGAAKGETVNVAARSNEELVELHRHPNEWFVRHARRVLHERQAAGADLSAVQTQLRKLFLDETDVPRKLRYFWTLQTLGLLDEPMLLSLLDHESEYLRSWAIRSLCDQGPPSPTATVRLAALSARETSAYVRLQLACSLQRLPLEARWGVAAGLLQRAEDAHDHNLPLMIWYGIEPLIDADLPRFAALAETTSIPLLTNHVARRVALHRRQQEGLTELVRHLPTLRAPMQTMLLDGMLDGLEGHRSVRMPTAWPTISTTLRSSSDPAVRESALRVALVFDDPTALTEQRTLAHDPSAAAAARNNALEALIRKHVKDLSADLLQLIDDPAVQRSAVRGLAEYDHADTPAKLIGVYGQLSSEARFDAVQTLATRARWANRLLDAVDAGTIPRGDLSAYTARQIDGLGDKELAARLTKLWGALRPTSEAKARQIKTLKASLTSDTLARADRSAGRQHFQKACANCHRLFGVGTAIGPDITGSQRLNLDYLLKTIIDPSAEVAKDYQMEAIATTSGRVVTGIVVNETAAAVTVQSVNEKIVLPKAEIDARKPSPQSLMPEGLLQNLTLDQTRQLFAYLMGTTQAPLPE